MFFPSDFLEIIILIGIIVFIRNLSHRVKRLEKFIESNLVQPKAEKDYQEIQQSQEKQVAIPESVIDYIKKQLKQGVAKDEVKNFLVANGWPALDIENILNTLTTNQDQATPPIAFQEESKETLSKRFIKWLKQDWLLKIGAFLLLIGFGWFVTYAFLNNWIGPMGRIAFGIIAGTLIMLLGYWRIQNYVTQGSIFLVLGSTIIILTIFAARYVYDFFTPFSALVVMFLSTAFVGLASVKYNNSSLAFMSLILASIVPFLTVAPTLDYVGLFSYLLVVILGTIWIVFLIGKRELTVAALTIVVLYSLPHLFSLNPDEILMKKLLLFAYAFSAIFFITNTAGFLKLKDREVVSDIISAGGNGLFLLAWIMKAAPQEWQSLIISFWMLVFTIGAFWVFRITQSRGPFYIYAGVAIAMLAAATSIELNGSALTIAYTIESGLIVLITYLVLRDIAIAERISLLLIGPIVLSFNSISSSNWFYGVLHSDFFVLLILALTLFGLGIFFLKPVRESNNEELQKRNFYLLIAASFYVYVLLWLSLHAGLKNDNFATMISLAIYTIVGIITYLYGFKKQKTGLRFYGGVLIGFVVVRLLLVEVWLMELEIRILTFFLIGALLISTAFLGFHKRKNNSLNNSSDNSSYEK
jgi:uncharacterized membrane protein